MSASSAIGKKDDVEKRPDERHQELVEAVTRVYAVRRSVDRFEEAGLDGWAHQNLLFALTRTVRHLEREISEILERRGIEYSEFLVLQVLFTAGADRPLLLGRIAKRMLVHPSTITKRIERLEKMGAVRRRKDDRDRRAVLVSLTDEGEDLIHELNRQLAEVQYGLVGISEDASLEVLERLMPVLERGR